MLNITVTDKKVVRTYYIIDINIKNAICMFDYDEQDALTKILELKESYEELYKNNNADVQEVFKNFIVVEIDQTVIHYSLGEFNLDDLYSISDVKYYYYTYSANAYQGKSGFLINEISAETLAEYLRQNNLLRLLKFIDKKILKCIKKISTFKKTFCLRYGYKIIYILVSPEYYKWAHQEGSDN